MNRKETKKYHEGLMREAVRLTRNMGTIKVGNCSPALSQDPRGRRVGNVSPDRPNDEFIKEYQEAYDTVRFLQEIETNTGFKFAILHE